MVKKLNISHIRKYIIILCLLLIAGGVGYRIGDRQIKIKLTSPDRPVANTQAPDSVSIDFSLFWDVWSRLHRYYIDKQDIDNQKMVWGAISGMVSALDDPYTVFLPPKENEEFKQDLGGSFEGIGAQLGLKEGRIIIVAPLKGSPSESAGIKAGDWIIKVNDEETIGWTIQQAVTKIRGAKGTKVTLNIIHAEEQNPVNIDIIRDTINVPAINSWVKKVSEIEEVKGVDSNLSKYANRNIAYIHLSRFGDRLQSEWTQAVDEILSSGKVDGLIFDLRNNPGGYLDGSVYIGSEFVGSGIIVSQQNSDGTKDEYRVARKGRLLDTPLVVLVNKGSASAAEIVAGALKDYGRAKIIGETSFGKGSVQTPQELTGGSGLHITTGKWLTPKGESISKKGITPDFEVKLENSASSDAQLAKAIEVLLK